MPPRKKPTCSKQGCALPAAKGRTMCAKHLAAQRERARKLTVRRTADHQCFRCGLQMRPRDFRRDNRGNPKPERCATCKAQDNRAAKAKRKQLATSGKCVSCRAALHPMDVAEDYTRCRACRKKSKARYNRRKKEGRCVRCGRPVRGERAGMVVCGSCT